MLPLNLQEVLKPVDIDFQTDFWWQTTAVVSFLIFRLVDATIVIVTASIGNSTLHGTWRRARIRSKLASKLMHVTWCVYEVFCLALYITPVNRRVACYYVIIKCASNPTGWTEHRSLAYHPGSGFERREAAQSFPQHAGPPCAHHEWFLPTWAIFQCQGEEEFSSANVFKTSQVFKVLKNSTLCGSSWKNGWKGWWKPCATPRCHCWSFRTSWRVCRAASHLLWRRPSRRRWHSTPAILPQCSASFPANRWASAPSKLFLSTSLLSLKSMPHPLFFRLQTSSTATLPHSTRSRRGRSSSWTLRALCS